MDAPAALLRLLFAVVVIAALWFFGDRLVGTVQAPAELRAARGNNAALKAGSDAQTKGVAALKADSEKREAKSKAAVNAAGGVQFKRAAEILAAPPQGESDYARAMNRVDRELGLK